ncbi:hypothetical protein BT63DRAFT_457184 [Microthyrium microscopicum]|uniref:Uncharacterized protein n=1 Tax=Microthyrium microscopicum TaxID=703497 RepID=A0A6A6U9A0_9PEZI|nr:hypothetical protein BT63DRAFT_457184 [Microthyrium microscopicum]
MASSSSDRDDFSPEDRYAIASSKFELAARFESELSQNTRSVVLRNPFGTALSDYDYPTVSILSTEVNMQTAQILAQTLELRQNVLDKKGRRPPTAKETQIIDFAEGIEAITTGQLHSTNCIQKNLNSMLGIEVTREHEMQTSEEQENSLQLFESATATALLRAQHNYLNSGYSLRISGNPELIRKVSNLEKLSNEVLLMIFEYVYGTGQTIEVGTKRVAAMNNQKVVCLPVEHSYFLSSSIVGPRLSQLAAEEYYKRNTFKVLFHTAILLPGRQCRQLQIEVRSKVDLLLDGDYFGSYSKGSDNIRHLILQKTARPKVVINGAPPENVHQNVDIENHQIYTTRHSQPVEYHSVFALQEFKKLESLELVLSDEYENHMDIRAFTKLLNRLPFSVKVYLRVPHLSRRLKINHWLTAPQDGDLDQYNRFFDFEYRARIGAAGNVVVAANRLPAGFGPLLVGASRAIAGRRYGNDSIRDWYMYADTIHPGAMRVFFAEHARTLP